MTSFTTRVELHNATWDDYDELHDEMEGRGFSRTIMSSDGTVYKMPWAEYNYIGDATLQDMLDKAKAAVAAAVPGKKRAILVTESNGRKWDGLDKA